MGRIVRGSLREDARRGNWEEDGGGMCVVGMVAAARGRRRRWPKGGGGGGSRVTVAAAMVSSWPGQGVAAVATRVAAVATGAATAVAAVGILPQPSVSSHLRKRKLFSFSNDG